MRELRQRRLRLPLGLPCEQFVVPFQYRLDLSIRDPPRSADRALMAIAGQQTCPSKARADPWPTFAGLVGAPTSSYSHAWLSVVPPGFRHATRSAHFFVSVPGFESKKIGWSYIAAPRISKSR
jgi:hypothetical protein